MLPWGHAALGYLLYSLYARRQYERPPAGLTVYALGIGTQFPDLVDKPLSWTLPVLPSGRSLGHSVFALCAIMLLLQFVVRYPDQRALVNAFGVGYATHLFGDGLGPAIGGAYGSLGYLLWPLTTVPSGGPGSFLQFFLALEPTPAIVGELALAGLAIAVWRYDGMPGVKDLLRPEAGESEGSSRTD